MKNSRNLRFASLDMKGRLVFDVEGAIAAGLWSDEIAAARALGVMIEQKRQRKKKRTPALHPYQEGR